MTLAPPGRGLIWLVFTLALLIGLVWAVLRKSAMPASPRLRTSASPPASDGAFGVVCFGTVELEHGVASLGPLQGGRVTEVLVVENQKVAAGAELLRLDDAAARSRLAEAETGVELARLQLRQARRQPELHAIRIAQQQANCDAMASRVAAARLQLAREKELAKSVVITGSDKSVNEEKIHELEALERAATRQLAELKAQDLEDDIKRAYCAVGAAEARRDQARLAVNECRLKAPGAGTVLRLLVAPGDVLAGQPAQPALLFAADGPRVIRATIEQEFSPRVKEGMPALLHDEADPSIAWRGRVSRLAGWYSERRTVLHDPAQFSDVRTLECVIALDDPHPPLRIGQSVRVVIGRVP
jgi:multidrug resistance efflux pump